MEVGPSGSGDTDFLAIVPFLLFSSDSIVGAIAVPGTPLLVVADLGDQPVPVAPIAPAGETSGEELILSVFDNVLLPGLLV
jgi:hypothetical protein